MLSLHLSYLQSSLRDFEQMLYSMQESIQRPDKIFEFLHLLRNAQQLLIRVDNYARTHLATITRRLPAVLLFSIFRFLDVPERKRTQLVCKVWYHVWKLPIVQKAMSKMVKSSGRLITSFPTTQAAYGIASYNNQIFVRCVSSVCVYEGAKNLVRGFAVRGSGSATSLAVDKNGLLYTPLYREHRIEVYTQHGDLVRSWNCKYPYALGVTNDHVIVSSGSSNSKKICHFTMEGTLVQEWKYEGVPSQIVVDQDEIFITDNSSHQVHVFSKDGKQLRQWGVKGSDIGQFNRPHGIAISEDLVYVVDRKSARSSL